MITISKQVKIISQTTDIVVFCRKRSSKPIIYYNNYNGINSCGYLQRHPIYNNYYTSGSTMCDYIIKSHKK